MSSPRFLADLQVKIRVKRFAVGNFIGTLLQAQIGVCVRSPLLLRNVVPVSLAVVIGIRINTSGDRLDVIDESELGAERENKP